MLRAIQLGEATEEHSRQMGQPLLDPVWRGAWCVAEQKGCPRGCSMTNMGVGAVWWQGRVTPIAAEQGLGVGSS